MKEKKHIDELFKGQLQNFEATPSPDVWAGIQSKLKKDKDDRKVLPLWWKLGGVAALLALLLTTGNFIFQPFATDSNTEIVSEEDPEANIKDESTTELTQEDISDDKDASEEDNNELIQNTEIANDKSEEVIEESLQNNESLNKPSESLKDQVINREKSKMDAVAVSSEKVDNETKKINPLIEKDTKINNAEVKDAVAITEETNKAVKNVEKVTSEKVDTETKETNPLIKKEISEEVISETKEAVANENTTNEKVEKDISEEIKTENKKSIFDAIEEDKEAEVAKLDVPKSQSWEVTPNFGPVFYNSIDGGSSIDPAFADNTQTGDVNFSYGVQVSYNISEKVSVRSGVNNVNLGYTTGGVELATGPVDVALKSIDYGGKNNVLSAFDKGTLNNLPPPTEGNPFSNLNPKSTSGNAELTQNLSYFEVPLELNYALLNNRFGINMIGGFSTLFLGSNEVSVRDGDFQEVLGEANNLNSVSFSTNVGLGFNYKISKRLKFNIEPMFKYQLNPYSDSSVNFRPYYLGVYSGLSFKF
ncbi:MAG: outer membrane beta-barrel protein [Flavobacteriaceae bacterium]|nr:outer membrane beta-barrel protein [Flavobacteriaceae bacterium]